MIYKIVKIIAVVLLILIIVSVLFVRKGITAIAPFIQKYEYIGNYDNLLSGLNRFAKDNDSIEVKVTDTTGTADASYSYYLTIIWKAKLGTINYDIVCDLPDHTAKQDKVKIGLAGAHDFDKGTGGYYKDDSGMNQLVVEFEHSLLPKLASKENINITKD